MALKIPTTPQSLISGAKFSNKENPKSNEGSSEKPKLETASSEKKVTERLIA
jgi:hypothetical protein